MPDLDTGHIFLTTFAPIKLGAPASDPQTSYEQRVRIALARLPTAQQSPATDETKFNSPFARNNRNHLARMFVVNNTIYNGRNTQNPIVAQLQGHDPLDPQPVDRLNAPYLAFCADIDAINGDGDPLPDNLSKAEQQEVRASYARVLWETMGEELKDLYSNCYGFENVETADDFATYLDKCHVETTMPFHDYYLTLPKFNQLPVGPLLLGVLVPVVIGLISLVLWLFGVQNLPILGWSTFWGTIGGILLGVLMAYFAVRFTIWNGAKPLPPATYDDLPSVLKSIYIQQKFSEFYIDNQGVSSAELHTEFGKFIAEHKPADRSHMTQKPGVISSANPKNVIS